MELRLLERVRDVDREAWNALVGPEDSPFVEWTWLDCLEEAGCVGAGTGWLPRHLALFDGRDLVAAAPAYVKGDSEGEFVFDWSWADLAHKLGEEYYPKLVVAVPFTPATGGRALVAPGRDRAETAGLFARVVATLTDELALSGGHVLFPTDAEVDAWTGGGMMLRHGVQYHWSNRGFSTFEDFLATLPSKKRTQIRRERSQPARDKVTIATLTPDELTPRHATAMFDLYTTTVDKYFYGRRYLNERFFQLVASRFGERLAWVLARDMHGKPIAGAFNVKRGSVLYGRYWGAFVDMPFLHFNVCFYHGIDDAIREGLRTFNPGAGGEHKRVRGFAPTLTSSAHHVRSPRMRSIIEPFLARERRAVTDLVETERREAEER
jgi:uncharacterized protein